MPKRKSLKQLRLLLSDDSPLSESQRMTLQKELHSGKVKIKGKK